MTVSLVTAIILLAAVILFWLIMSYKGFVNLRNSAAEAFATTEFYMKKRRELILQMIKLIRKAKLQDADLTDVLQNAMDAGNLAKKAVDRDEKIICERAVKETMDTLLCALERVQELDHNKTCVSLRKQLSEADQNVSRAGGFYNTIVTMMNKRVHVFPSSLIAKLFHFTDQPML